MSTEYEIDIPSEIEREREKFLGFGFRLCMCASDRSLDTILLVLIHFYIIVLFDSMKCLFHREPLYGDIPCGEF